MQRLRATEDCRHGLNRGAYDVVLWLLRGERRTGCLGMEAQHPRARVPRFEMLAHDARPHAASSAELSDFFQKIAVRVEEKGHPGRELVDIKPRFNGR